MDLTTLLQFVRPELVILIVFVWCIGLFLKKVPAFTDEWKIPFILIFIGIIFTVLYIAFVLGEGVTAAVLVSSIIQGVIIAALAVLGNETIKQYFVKRPEDNKKGV